MDLAEYYIDEQDVREWLPWGGLVRENVVRNKDGSFFGVLSYEKASVSMPALILPRGWSIWSEEQHGISSNENQLFFVICWNPFWERISDAAENALGNRKIIRKQAPDYFAEELARIANIIPSCQVLKYQEIVDFLSWALSFGEHHVPMPAIPLYFDILLANEIEAKFEGNGLSILGKSVKVLSLPSSPRDKYLDFLRKGLSDIPYRYVRRLLTMDTEAAQDEIKAYTKGWCSSRGYIKRFIMQGILLKMNGYYNEQIIFSLSDDAYLEYIHRLMSKLQLPYILEGYNLKDVWWGSLAGCFRANIRPMITGFNTLNEFLIQPVKTIERSIGASNV